MVLIELLKAFDTINHEFLLRKMTSLGFSNQSIMWSQFYLSNRSFLGNIKNKCSSIDKSYFGVTQGSSLGTYCFFNIEMMKQAVDCDFFL